MSGAVVAIIFARGGSKGLPGKNLAPIGGKPLIAHAIEAAQEARTVDRVVMSTDDPEIAGVAEEWGAEVPFLRPSELARDDSPEWLAWRHALDAVDKTAALPVEIFVSVPPTAPLRLPGDIDACVERFREGDVDVVLTATAAARNPYFNMVTLDASGRADLVIPPGEGIHNRQSAPAVYDLTTVCYVARPDFLRTADHLFAGRVGAVLVPRERAVDIDDKLDLAIARTLMDTDRPCRPRAR